MRTSCCNSCQNPNPLLDLPDPSKTQSNVGTVLSIQHTALGPRIDRSIASAWGCPKGRMRITHSGLPLPQQEKGVPSRCAM